MSERELSLNDYGHAFQMKILAAMMSDRSFLIQFTDILHPDYFVEDSIIWIVQKIQTYFREYRKTPSIDFFKVEMEKVSDVLQRDEIRKILKNAAQQIPNLTSDNSDYEFVKNTVSNFCRTQHLKKALIDSVEYLKMGKYDKIIKEIQNANSVGLIQDLGSEYVQNLESRYNEAARAPIPTGWDIINDLTKGGLAPGELGIVIGASGSGKSWLLMHIGAAAIKAGKKVLHITLELDENYTGIRYDSILTGISSVNLPDNLAEVKRIISKYEGLLRIQFFPTKSLSTNNLKAFIHKVRLSGFDPELIIIDYLDIMKLPVNSENHLALQSHYEDIRGLAGEERVPVWSASQGNREAINSDVLGADKISGSYGKIFTADFAMSFSRKDSDKLTNTGRALIIKNRFGPDGMTLPVKINTYIGQIEIYAEKTQEGQHTKNQMISNEEYNRKLLKNKYQSLSNVPNF